MLSEEGQSFGSHELRRSHPAALSSGLFAGPPLYPSLSARTHAEQYLREVRSVKSISAPGQALPPGREVVGGEDSGRIIWRWTGSPPIIRSRNEGHLTLPRGAGVVAPALGGCPQRGGGGLGAGAAGRLRACVQSPQLGGPVPPYRLAARRTQASFPGAQVSGLQPAVEALGSGLYRRRHSSRTWRAAPGLRSGGSRHSTGGCGGCFS